MKQHIPFILMVTLLSTSASAVAPRAKIERVQSLQPVPSHPVPAQPVPVQQVPMVQVLAPWIRPTAGQPTAAYMKLVNPSPEDVYLTGISSPEAGGGELHANADRGMGTHMQAIQKIRVPGNGNIVLQPGGTHVMLTNVKKPFKVGEFVPVKFTFSNGSILQENIPVKAQ